MRYSLIIASFAVALLAAPVPQTQPLALEKRWIRNGDNTFTNGDAIQERKVDLEERAYPEINPKREPEPEPMYRQNVPDKRDPEPEPMYRQNVPDKREPEAEPMYRQNVPDKRDPDPEPIYRQNVPDKREPEAEPMYRQNVPDKREPEAEADSGLRTTDKREDDLDLRSIYNSAVGIVEALKARGFSSDMLLDPK